MKLNTHTHDHDQRQIKNCHAGGWFVRYSLVPQAIPVCLSVIYLDISRAITHIESEKWIILICHRRKFMVSHKINKH